MTKGNKTMNRLELVSAMAEQAGISKKDANNALKAFTNIVMEEVSKGEKVQVVGFGTFEPHERCARTSFGKEIDAMTVPKFRAGKGFKEAVAK